MSVRLAVLTFVAAVACAGPVFAADPRVDAFRALCADHPKDNAATAAAAATDGWAAITTADSPALAKLMDALADPDDKTEASATFHKTLSTGEAFLVVTRLATAGSANVFASCGIYDFAAKAPVGEDEVTTWLSGPGNATEDDPRSGVEVYWDGPQKLDEPWTISVRFNPPGGMMNDMDGFTGAALGSWIVPADDDDAGDQSDEDNK